MNQENRFSRPSLMAFAGLAGFLAGAVLLLAGPPAIGALSPGLGDALARLPIYFGGDIPFLFLWFALWTVVGILTGLALTRHRDQASSSALLTERTGFHGRRSFTLIELLIVIAIIAVLATVVILVLNPSELLKEARDVNRLSDLANLQQALTLYAEDQGGFPLASSGVTYLSLPDPTATTTAGTDCSGLGGSFAGGNFHCPASSTYRNTDGTGWLPVNFKDASFGSPFGTLPVDPVNTSSSGEYYAFETNGTTFKLWAVPESQTYLNAAGKDPNMFQVGNNLALGGGQYWVLVPGNSSFGTNNFWVMKYDAKCFSGTTPLMAPNTGYDTYDNNTQPCTGSYTVGTAPDGYPIANIDQTTAASYCAVIGGHLLTNDEYMTIAVNAAEQGSNWSGGSPGSGYLYSGHNDNAPANALEASSDDTNGYYGETNTGGNQRRTLIVSNGSVVWDLAGNVWEHIQWGDLTTTTMAFPACSNAAAGWEWCEYGGAGTVNNSAYVSSWPADVPQAEAAPPNASWNSTNGMGQVYTYGTGANQGTFIFLRGVYWTGGSAAGAFALGLALWNTGNSNFSVGFRCAR